MFEDKGLLNFRPSADQKKRKRLKKVPQTLGTLTKTRQIKTSQHGHCNDLRKKERRQIEKQEKEKKGGILLRASSRTSAHEERVGVLQFIL